ncbi:RidA family protein [Pseudomonas putida]|uniref:RidA family protein n=1 Tax=Pseudomonas putida TaxID=303 RepID=UPI00404596E9
MRADSRLLFIAGQGGEDSQGQLSPVFADQARQALANLERALASKGASLAQVFKLTPVSYTHLDVYKRQTHTVRACCASMPMAASKRC